MQCGLKVAKLAFPCDDFMQALGVLILHITSRMELCLKLGLNTH